MRVVQLDEQSEIFTLCFENNGDLQPITDFDNQKQAHHIEHLINKTGYSIKLTEHSTTREFSIGLQKENSFEVFKTANDLTQALAKLNIKVDFLVEPPPIEIHF